MEVKYHTKTLKVFLKACDIKNMHTPSITTWGDSIECQSVNDLSFGGRNSPGKLFVYFTFSPLMKWDGLTFKSIDSENNRLLSRNVRVTKKKIAVYSTDRLVSAG